MLNRSLNLSRKVFTNFVRTHSHGGIPGEVNITALTQFVILCNIYHLPKFHFTLQNLPFDITNRYKLTALFVVFFGSGLGAPFFVLRHQLLKK